MRTRITRAVLAAGLCLVPLTFSTACRGRDEHAANTNAATNTRNANAAAGVNSNAATTAPAASANDATIRSSVEENLRKAGVAGVTVRVESGVVYLTGTVPSANFTKAMQAANEANPKPTRVDNSGLRKS